MTDYTQMSRGELIALVEALKARPPSAGSALAKHRSARQKVAQSALSDSEERLSAILETAVEGIITIDERGRIESMNPAAQAMFGYAAGEVSGRNVSLLMPSPHREAHDEYLARYLRTGEAKIIGIGREVLGRRKDGTVFPVDLSVSEVRLTDRRLFTGFIRDITARRQAEEQLRLLSAALESAANGIAITDAHGRVLWVNPAFSRLTGYSCDEVTGRNLRLLKSGKHPASFYRGLWETILRGDPWQGEMVNRRKDGSLYPEEMTITPVRAGTGAITHFVAVKHEITERKRAEERLASLAQTLAEKNKELEAIVYVASHDLRSPLVNIQGFSQELARACGRVRSLLGQGKDPPAVPAELPGLLAEDIPEALNYIQAGVAKIDSLLSGFLRYSRLGRAALNIGRLDMQAMVAGISRTMEFQIKQAGAALRVQTLPDCLGDATQINQVFSNLLDNAVKYLDPARPGVITVAGRLEADRAVYVVRDNGIGIAPEHQVKIFEIFHRLNPSRSEGEGLGLTIAQRILERQSGKILVESEPGKGTAFFVSLPAPPRAE
jgi:chemotaxis family two-component system sensor kinase Cph1